MDLRNILNSGFENKEVLCVYRKDKAAASEYRKLIKNFCSQHLEVENPDSISEYRESANHYIDLKKYDISDYTQDDFDIFKSCINVPDILRKDRIFRKHLNYYQAHDLITSTTKYFIELFKINKYKIIVTQVIDNYVGDIMARVALHYNIHAIGLVKFFYSGYTRITLYGEHNTIRSVQDDEVDEIYLKLISKTKSDFKLNKGAIFKELMRQYATYKVKYLVHYLIFHKLMGKLEYDYIGTPGFEYPNKLKNFFPRKIFEKNLSRIENLDKTKTIYIPLHYYPEATTEYWVESADLSPYYPSVFETAQILSNKGYNIVFKEHPASYLRRDLSIYKKLNSIDNTYLVDPFISTYKVLELVDFVVVWTGTSGIEAIMQNKKVAIASENYYSNNLLPRYQNIEETYIFDELQKKDIIRKILENCLPL